MVPTTQLPPGRRTNRIQISIFSCLPACVHSTMMVLGGKERGKESGRAELRVLKKRITLQRYVCCSLTSKERWKFHLSEFPRRLSDDHRNTGIQTGKGVEESRVERVPSNIVSHVRFSSSPICHRQLVSQLVVIAIADSSSSPTRHRRFIVSKGIGRIANTYDAVLSICERFY